jgi:hypothetical protein
VKISRENDFYAVLRGKSLKILTIISNYNKEPFVRTQFIVTEIQLSGSYFRNAALSYLNDLNGVVVSNADC